MTTDDHSRPWLSSLLGVLLLACAPPPLTGEDSVADADAGTDETGGSETDTGSQECEHPDSELPPDDPSYSASYLIWIINNGEKPIWLVPPSDCTDTIVHSMQLADGKPGVDDVIESCSSLAENACGSCDESFGHPPIRIDTDGSYEWSFDGSLFEIYEFASACGFGTGCWDGLECGARVAVDKNALVEAQLRFTDECLLGAACECPDGESACELPMITNGMGFGGPQTATFAFNHDNGLLPLVFLDAG